MLPVNYFAVFVSTVLNMAVGALWYSPALFAKPWMKAMGFDKQDMDKQMRKGVGPKYIVMFVGSLVTAYVLSLFVSALGVQTFVSGFRLGFLVWLGFTTTAQLANWIFSGKPKELYFINTTYQLVSYCLMGGLLAVWR